MSLGGKRSPFASYNPFMRPSHSVMTQQTRIPWPIRGSLTQTTTTDTTNGAIVASTTANIVGGEVAILALIQVHLRHTVASAEAKVGLELYNGPTTSDTPAFTVWFADFNLSPTAGDWALISMTCPVYFARPSWTPGNRLFQVRCTPVTAGTLSVSSPTAGTDDQLNIFILGWLQI